jgi:hypothetical protein
MFFATFRLMMGSFVRFLSQFYSKYSLYINFIVMVYGLSILWVHNNLRTIIRNMEIGIEEIAKANKPPYDYRKVFRNFYQVWKIKNQGLFSFIPSKRDLWFEKVNNADLPGLLNINEDYVKMALHKRIGEPLESQFPSHVYIAWDEYRHALVRGLRKRFISPKEIKSRTENQEKK